MQPWLSKDKKTGRFVKKRNVWSLENFNDGYIDATGRFRVYKPGHHRAYSSGYVLRSIVAFEEFNKIKVEPGFEVHHVDFNRSNDSKENLVLLSRHDHAKLHSEIKQKKSTIQMVCTVCKKEFPIKKHRLREKGRGKYCSQKCCKINRGKK